jgi:hypothetical protein
MSRKTVPACCSRMLLLAAAGLSQAIAQSHPPPLGVYAHINVEVALKRKFGTKLPSPEKQHAYLQGLYASLLDHDDAVSGITLGVHWDRIEVSPPSCAHENNCLPPTETTDGYDWSWLDDVFIEAHTYKKSVQLILTPGVDSPTWLLNELLPSCNALFEPATGPPGQDCGQVNFSVFPESSHADGSIFPLPWSTTYENAWKQFLGNVQKQYGSKTEFASIAIAGPIGASTEMILPTTLNKSFQNPSEPADNAWSALIANSFPLSSTAYQHSDQVFIDWWEKAIANYEHTFSDITLILSPDSGDDLPEYGDNVLGDPGWLFDADCSEDTEYPMSCSAKTDVLSYFLARKTGNRKATDVGGMTAASQVTPGSTGIGVGGIKVLTSLKTESPRILGGAEFDYSVSETSTRQQEGCWKPNGKCPPLTTEEAAYYVLKVFFDETPFADYYGGTDGSTPIQWVDIDYIDILYAQTHPKPALPTTVPCAPSLQELLERASWDLFTIEGKKPPVPEPTCN